MLVFCALDAASVGNASPLPQLSGSIFDTCRPSSKKPRASSFISSGLPTTPTIPQDSAGEFLFQMPRDAAEASAAPGRLDLTHEKKVLLVNAFAVDL